MPYALTENMKFHLYIHAHAYKYMNFNSILQKSGNTIEEQENKRLTCFSKKRMSKYQAMEH